MKHFAAALLLMIVVGYVAADWSCYLDGASQECIGAAAVEDYDVLCTTLCTDHFESRISKCNYNPEEEADFISRCQESLYF